LTPGFEAEMVTARQPSREDAMRQHLVTVIAATIAAVSVSFAVAQATSQPAQSSASNRAVVRQLQKTNAKLDQVVGAIGTSKYSGLRGQLGDELGTLPSNTARHYLEVLCENLRQSGQRFCF
jgi:hypothetical protein